MMKRIFYFALVNIAVMVTFSIVFSLVSPFLTGPDGTSILQGTGYGGSAHLNLPGLLVICLMWGMVGSVVSLFLSKFMVKRMLRIEVIDPNTHSAELRELVQTVHQLARRAGLRKMPEVGIYNSPEVNALATGATKNSSLVAVSSGLLQRMNRDQVEGVLGHEVAHIANGDMVTMTLIQGVMNAFVLFFSRIVGSIIASQVEERQRFMVEFGVTIVLQIVFGILAAFVVNYFSRFREYRADAGGARFAGREKMVSALQALKNTVDLAEPDQGATAALKISSNPKSRMMQLLSTHPSLDDRIRRLQGLRSA